MGLLDRGAAFLNRMDKIAAGVTITYIRGAARHTITAVPGNTRFAQSAPEPGGATLIHGERDYLIDVADLPFAEPLETDRIIETIGGIECVFDVARPSTGEPAVRHSDDGKTKWRIHVTQVK